MASSQLDKPSRSNLEFIVWIVNQKEGINAAVIAQRFEVRKKKEAEEVHCLRGVMQP